MQSQWKINCNCNSQTAIRMFPIVCDFREISNALLWLFEENMISA